MISSPSFIVINKRPKLPRAILVQPSHCGDDAQTQMKMECVKQTQRRHKDEEGVKVLHTKSQAGRTQKSRPPAASFERHLLGRTVKLGTACERGRTGRTGREETEHSYETLEPELRARCARTAHRGTSLQDRPARQWQGSGLSPTGPDCTTRQHARPARDRLTANLRKAAAKAPPFAIWSPSFSSTQMSNTF